MWEFSAIGRGGIAGVVDEDFLRGDEDAHGGLEALDVEGAVGLLELHQVERGEIAGGVVEEEIFGAGIGRVLPVGALAGVPAVDGVVELHAGIAADPGALGDLAQEVLGALLFARLAVADGLRPEFLVLDRRVHELVAGADGEVFVLVHDRAVGFAVVGAVVALLDERPGFPLLLLLGEDEFLDVGVLVLERVHLRGATGLAAAFHDVGDLVVDLEEGEGAAGASAAAHLFAGGADGGEIGAGARSRT